MQLLRIVMERSKKVSWVEWVLQPVQSETLKFKEIPNFLKKVVLCMHLPALCLCSIFGNTHLSFNMLEKGKC